MVRGNCDVQQTFISNRQFGSHRQSAFADVQHHPAIAPTGIPRDVRILAAALVPAERDIRQQLRRNATAPSSFRNRFVLRELRLLCGHRLESRLLRRAV